MIFLFLEIFTGSHHCQLSFDFIQGLRRRGCDAGSLRDHDRWVHNLEEVDVGVEVV